QAGISEIHIDGECATGIPACRDTIGGGRSLLYGSGFAGRAAPHVKTVARGCCGSVSGCARQVANYDIPVESVDPLPRSAGSGVDLDEPRGWVYVRVRTIPRVETCQREVAVPVEIGASGRDNFPVQLYGNGRYSFIGDPENVGYITACAEGSVKYAIAVVAH